MNDLKDTPTADLIAEWVKSKGTMKYWSEFPAVGNECAGVGMRQRNAMDSATAIAAELDKRATDAGIAIYENQFVYNTTEFWITHTRNLEHDIMTLAANGNITAKEQHDLEGWLLLKGGAND